jgi:uncharacterized protein (DUF58 family)
VRSRDNFSRIRSELRAQLTVGERVFYYGWTALIVGLPTVAIALAVSASGTARAVGIALLFVTLVLYAVPVSSSLRRRVRRREAGPP